MFLLISNFGLSSFQMRVAVSLHRQCPPAPPDDLQQLLAWCKMRDTLLAYVHSCRMESEVLAIESAITLITYYIECRQLIQSNSAFTTTPRHVNSNQWD
jgi:hypothetical protein